MLIKKLNFVEIWCQQRQRPVVVVEIWIQYFDKVIQIVVIVMAVMQKALKKP